MSKLSEPEYESESESASDSASERSKLPNGDDVNEVTSMISIIPLETFNNSCQS
jgi:hypothetical protein